MLFTRIRVIDPGLSEDGEIYLLAFRNGLKLPTTGYITALRQEREDGFLLQYQ